MDKFTDQPDLGEWTIDVTHNGEPLIRDHFMVSSSLPVNDTIAPTITKLVPTDDSSHPSINQDLIIEFDEDVQRGTGDISIYRADDDSIVETIDINSTQVTVNSNALNITPNIDLSDNTHYYVTVSAGAVADLGGNNFDGIADNETWNFTFNGFGDFPPPTHTPPTIDAPPPQDTDIIPSPVNQILNGNRRRNRLIGGDGDDVLIGGSGRDRNRGGNGNDTFMFRRHDMQARPDIIFDFEVGSDVIHLLNMFRGKHFSSDNPLSEYVLIKGSGRWAVIQFDENGDKEEGGFKRLVVLKGIAFNTIKINTFMF